MYMHVWRHLRFGAVLRYAGITLLLLIFGVGLYFQFGTQALSYVSGFGRNSEQPLIVGNLPAQQATIITTGGDWQQTLNGLVAPLDEGSGSSTEYQNTMVDDLIGMYLKEKMRVGQGGSVDGEAVARKYFKEKTYYSSVLRFQESTFRISRTASTTVYAKELQHVVQIFNDKTAAPASQAFLAYQKNADSKDLAPLIQIQPIIQNTLDTLLAMEVPAVMLSLHKQAAEILLNQAYYISQITESNGDVIQEFTAVSGYMQTLEDGPSIYSRIMALK